MRWGIGKVRGEMGEMERKGMKYVSFDVVD